MCHKNKKSIFHAVAPVFMAALVFTADAGAQNPDSRTTKDEKVLLEAARCGSVFKCMDFMLGGEARGQVDIIDVAAARILALQRPNIGDRLLSREYNKKGLNEISKGEFVLASDFFAEGFRVNPGDVEIAANYGYSLSMAGRSPEALEPLAAALLINPRRTSNWAPLVKVFFDLGMIEEARASALLSYRFSSNKEKTQAFFYRKSIEEQSPLSSVYRSALTVIEDREFDESQGEIISYYRELYTPRTDSPEGMYADKKVVDNGGADGVYQGSLGQAGKGAFHPNGVPKGKQGYANNSKNVRDDLASSAGLHGSSENSSWSSLVNRPGECWISVPPQELPPGSTCDSLSTGVILNKSDAVVIAIWTFLQNEQLLVRTIGTQYAVKNAAAYFLDIEKRAKKEAMEAGKRMAAKTTESLSRYQSRYESGVLYVKGMGRGGPDCVVGSSWEPRGEAAFSALSSWSKDCNDDYYKELKGRLDMDRGQNVDRPFLYLLSSP